MIDAYVKKNFEEFFSKLPILLRPIINLTIFYILSKQLTTDYKYVFFAFSIITLQLDLIITTNHHFFLIIKDSRLYDIVISKNNIYVVVLLESSFSLIYYMFLQFFVTLFTTEDIVLSLLSIFISLISIIIGLSILPLTLKNKSFLLSSKIASVLLLFSCVLIPLKTFGIFSYLILTNIFTPIFEFIRSIFFEQITYTSLKLQIIYIILDLCIVGVIFVYSTTKIHKYIN